MRSGIGSFASYFESYAEFSQNGELEAYWNEEMITRYSARYYVINDRIYAAFVYGSTSMQGQQEDVYAGSDLLLVMLDAETYELLYAEKYHSPNYYMGARGETISLYQKGADGFLYDWRILE